MTDDGDERPPDHPGRGADADEPAPDEAGQYRTGEETTRGAADEGDVDVDEGFFARIPETVVALGAGSLATTALLTAAAAVFTGYSVATGQYYDYEPYQMVLATVQFTFAAVFQIVGVYFARKRTRWLWVMLASLSGILSIIGIPFAIVAVICLGLGKYHFTSYTPLKQIRDAI